MKKVNIGYTIITSAIIWGAILISCALKVKGTPYAEGINFTLTIGVITHLLFVWIPLGAQNRKRKKALMKEE